MIIITGSVLTNPDNRAEIEALCVAHCQRSRAESGCMSHQVHSDCETPDLLVFVERWQDGAAVLAHFQVPESGAFVKKLAALATDPPHMTIYAADEILPSALASLTQR
jgi:quinol monooxygenase YgiN